MSKKVRKTPEQLISEGRAILDNLEFLLASRLEGNVPALNLEARRLQAVAYSLHNITLPRS